jgi:ribosomal protein S18 acetylase RimI-like enzyme
MILTENKTITFRQEVRPSDYDAVKRILASTGFFRPDEVDVALELVQEYLSRGNESGYHFFFVDVDDETVGYTCYGEIPCTIKNYDLYWIAVDSHYHRSGLGRQLLHKTEDAIRTTGGRFVYIETSGRAQYQPTVEFYLRMDYELVAELNDYYDVNDSKLIFTKQL